MAKVEVTADFCKSCQLCIKACPKDVLQIGKTVNANGYEVVEMKEGAQCIACKNCAVMCPEAAIEVYR